MKRILLALTMTVSLAIAADPGSDRLIQFYQDHVLRDDTDYANYDRLGSAYLQKARETGDPVYYNLSEKAFGRALSLTAGTRDSAGVTAHLAGLDLAEHRFAEAHALAQKTLELKPDLLSVYAVLGDSELESGDYEDAQRDYAHLNLPEGSLPPRPGITYLADTRQAGLSFIRGNTQAAITHTLAAIADATDAGLPKENIAWSQFSLGELYLATGDYQRAEAAYQSALETYPNYHRALAWLGQLRAAQGRYTEAIDLYRRAIAIIPLPVYAAALGDIYAHVGQPKAAQDQYDLVAVIARLSALNQNLFRRELAFFYADRKIHLDEALSLAQEELASRKDVYTWDVFAWVAFQNGKTAEAADAIGHALAQGTDEPLFLFHAGMIFDRLGDSSRARQYFRRALELNPGFHIVYADVARQMLEQPEVARAH
jgi:tetratricopeptide (TPR) repeat protein